MTSTSARLSRARGLRRVAVYYVLFAALLWLAVAYVPAVRSAVSGSRLLGLGNGDLDQLVGGQIPPVGPVAEMAPWGGALLAAISMLGALAIMVPVTWVYMITRRVRGWDESVVHTLLILPVAVTGIVMIVQNSVALAFSLAGIVAAVRFRTTLEDTKDAVYVFLAIGVGLATGVQALGIALVLSVVFNAVVLTLWRTQFGNIYADRNGRPGALTVADVSAGPASAAAALQVGDAAVLEATAPADLAAIADRAVRVERYISEERKKKKARRANALLFVHAERAEPAQAYVDTLLEELATRFKLVEVGPGPSGALLEYVARLDGPAVQGTVMDRLREGHDGAIAAAELRSLQGLKPRA
jgi:hypothetical protein